MKKMGKSLIILLIILLIAGTLRFIALDSIPGLHFDEARYGLTARDIIELKGLPLVGQREYIGNFTPLLIASNFLLLSSQNIFTLRFVFALLGTSTVALVFLSLCKINKTIALVSCSVAAILPFMVIFSRIAFEFSLIPFFTALGLYLLLEFQRTKKDKYLYLLFLYLGFGIQNQMVFALIAIFFAFFALKQVLSKKQIAKTFICFSLMALALTPILIDNLTKGFPLFKTFGGGKEFSPNLYFIFIKDFIGILDGRLIYLRTAGSLQNYIPYINTSFFLLSVAWLAARAKKDKLRKFLLVFLVYYFAVAPLFFAKFGYTYAIRYFLTFYPIGIIPIGMLLADLYSYKKIFLLLIVFFIAINIIQLYNNFFFNIYWNEGDFTTFDIGYPETSSHFLASFPKMGELLERYKTVYFYEPAGFHDVESILRFLIQEKTELIKINGISDKGKTYFAFDFDNENITYGKLGNLDRFTIREIDLNNRAGAARLKLYIIE
jgi:4-amino-4-deoxy-L-arabinose transferase-like glycosyltransferase